MTTSKVPKRLLTAIYDPPRRLIQGMPGDISGHLRYLALMKPKLVVCASGEGSNFEAIVKATRSGALSAEVVGLVANRPAIGAIGRAKLLGIPHKIVNGDLLLKQRLELWQADWVVLAGYLALIGPEVLKAFPQRIVNSHPSLLPKFGGKGMYGDRVHQAVIDAKATESGVTIHTIDDQYDRGMILAQETVTVLPKDTAATLSDRVKAREILLYPKVLNDLVTGRITVG